MTQRHRVRQLPLLAASLLLVTASRSYAQQDSYTILHYDQDWHNIPSSKDVATPNSNGSYTVEHCDQDWHNISSSRTTIKPNR